MQILHLSDTHFGTERTEVMDALLQFAAVHRPDVLVLSGDITQRARPLQFAAAHAFIDRLAIPHRIVIPGNHDLPLFDLPTRLLHPYRHFEAFFGATESSYENERLLVLALNTCRLYRHKNGEISAAQREAVARRLRNASDRQLRIVVTHQPIHVIESKDTHNRVRGYREALQTWSEAGADVVLGGHIHLPYCRRVDSITLARPIWAVQAGTAVSKRIRGEIDNSFNMLIYDDDHAAAQLCNVQRWDYVANRYCFEKRNETRIPLHRR